MLEGMGLWARSAHLELSLGLPGRARLAKMSLDGTHGGGESEVRREESQQHFRVGLGRGPGRDF